MLSNVSGCTSWLACAAEGRVMSRGLSDIESSIDICRVNSVDCPSPASLIIGWYEEPTTLDATFPCTIASDVSAKPLTNSPTVPSHRAPVSRHSWRVCESRGKERVRLTARSGNQDACRWKLACHLVWRLPGGHTRIEQIVYGSSLRRSWSIVIVLLSGGTARWMQFMRSQIRHETPMGSNADLLAKSSRSA